MGFENTRQNQKRLPEDRVREFLQKYGPQKASEIARRLRGIKVPFLRTLANPKLSKGMLLQSYKVGKATYYGLRDEVGLGDPEKLYSTIYCDIPWLYRDRGIRGAARHHYEDMRSEVAEALPVLQRVLPDAAMYFWITVPKFTDAIMSDEVARILRAWGFRPKTVIVWLKAKGKKDGRHVLVGGEDWFKLVIGPGHHFRGVLEFCLYCTRGKMKIPPGLRKPNAFIHDRTSTHSRKPPSFREWITDITKEPRLELFAETKAKGWDRWGKPRKGAKS